MKNITLLICLALLVLSCKSDTKKEQEEVKTPLSVSEKIANVYGFENWDSVSEIAFTFNVDRDSSHFERSWRWNPKTNDVLMISGQDSIQFNHKRVDSLSTNADRSFINDKFWLLVPFQLEWDQSASISEAYQAEAPISKTLLNKITLTYPDNGGYTPGDAYDIFYNDNFLIKEWVYRKANSETPSLITTWENYQDFNGIKIGMDHIKSEGNWRLYFTNIKVTIN